MAKSTNPKGQRKTTHPKTEPEKPPRAPAKRTKKDKAADERLKLTTHREFGEATPEIFRRLMANPQSLTLLLANPALAMEDAGIDLSPELRHHVLHVLQHPPQLRARRDELEKRLRGTLDEQPRPNDPEWLSKVLFKKLKLKPLNVEGLTPVYKSNFSPRLAERAAAKRRKWDELEKTTGAKRPSMMGLGFKMGAGNVRRLDLDAPVPKRIPRLRTAPKTVSLEELYFYKDQDDVARDLLELAIIERRGFPIQSADGYRKVKSGEQPNLFATWITGIRLSTEKEGDDVADR